MWVNFWKLEKNSFISVIYKDLCLSDAIAELEGYMKIDLIDLIRAYELVNVNS